MKDHEGHLRHHDDPSQGRQSRSFKGTQQMALPLRERSVPKESSVSSEGVRVREEDAPGQGREEDQDQVEFSPGKKKI